jgi:hypothetical protein
MNKLIEWLLKENPTENVNIEQKVRLLETRVVENAETIDQLRNERGILATDHKELQRRFAEASEVRVLLRRGDFTCLIVAIEGCKQSSKRIRRPINFS